MAGGNTPKGSSQKQPPSSSSSHRKTRWESGNNPSADQKTSGAGASNPSPKPNSNPKHNLTTPKPGPTPSPSHPNPPTGPSPKSGPDPIPSDRVGLGPPPPPSYGFHMLERRTIVLADGSVRSYFALPPDYQDFIPQRRPHGSGFGGPELGLDNRFPPVGPMSPEFRNREGPFNLRNRNQDYWNSLGLDGRGGPMPTPMQMQMQMPPPENSLKRKFGDESEMGRREEREGKDEKDEFARQRQQLLQYGNAGLNPNGYPVDLGGRGDFLAGTSRGDELRGTKFMRISDNVPLKHHDVDQGALKNAFMHYVKLVNENVNLRKNYLEDGKQGPLQCVACGRSSTDFPDMHSLIMHTYNSDSADKHVEHLGLHKALCVVMGWNYSKPPDNSKTYQFVSADEASANQDDIIMWPPMVIIHNTGTGKGRDGRLEGLGNKAMDSKLREIGFGGKSKSVYGKDGHLGITLVKFAGDQAALKEAVRLHEHFEKENHGRKGWARLQSLTSGKDDDNNPNLVKVDEKTGEKKRIFYGYLGTVFDLDKVDFETRKKVSIESRREYKP